MRHLISRPKTNAITKYTRPINVTHNSTKFTTSTVTTIIDKYLLIHLID